MKKFKREVGQGRQRIPTIKKTKPKIRREELSSLTSLRAMGVSLRGIVKKTKKAKSQRSKRSMIAIAK